ncbi:transposase [Streptomyces sp. MA5143a]|uniref:transposase n=1 Tax=Streptomyces sp. MA5143a TaxID=2083010 RepID=UPI000D199A92|nr:transposase [Streptomyces sp. MA5143a]SPF06936.1 FOG: Transposase [Streptomyces sp. MA5143a]
MPLRGPAPHGHRHRALIEIEDWAGDDERREGIGVLDETVLATKPQLAGDMLTAAHAAGIRTAWVAADQVYGGSALRRRIRTLGYGYAIAVSTSHRVTTPGGGKEKFTLLQRGAEAGLDVDEDQERDQGRGSTTGR